MLDPQRYQRAKAIFFDACEQPRDGRDAFVDRACQGDADLRAAVRQLLSHDDEPMSMINAGRMRDHLEQLAESSSADGTGNGASRPREHALPERIGRYRILSRLGAGGMGVVYLAEQENPRRQVALKVIAAGQASRQTLRRFEHEAQILGRLHHPGIAQVYEAGMHDSGEGAQPYFAMELVRGRPLLQHCEHASADRRARLELFMAICEAVQHAHQQGVIHRDLKPANILVEQRDEEAIRDRDEETKRRRDEVKADGGPPQPGTSSLRFSVSPCLPHIKILEFGVARLTDSDVQATTMHTAADQLIGTVAYMSPEQMSGKPEAIDTTSDVYALGVILFELLAGRLPHDVAGKTIPEMIRTISDSEPTTLSSIDRRYRGDLDTIVGKAMERDKARRYQSAGELAAEVRRFLNDEPIQARPPSTLYQMSKFARRNKALVGGVAAVFLALVAGMVTTTWQARLALAARDQQKKLREEADLSASRAQAEADKATAVNVFLRRMLASANPEVTQGREVLVGEVLDSAASEISAGALARQPEVEAQVHMTIGETYLSIGRADSARTHLETAMSLMRSTHGAASVEATSALMLLAVVHNVQGDLDQAVALTSEALEILRSVFGNTDRVEIARALKHLSEYRMSQGRSAEAIDLRRQSVEMFRRLKGDNDVDVAEGSARLAGMLHDPGEAEPLVRTALATFREQRGETSPDYVNALRTLAGLLMMRGAYDEAEAVSRQALALGTEVYGRDHQRNLLILQNLAFCLRLARKLEALAEVCDDVVGMARRLYGGDSMRLAEALIDRADVRRAMGDAAGTEADNREAVAVAERAGLARDPRACVARLSVASLVLNANGDLTEVESLAQAVLDTKDQLKGEQQWLEGKALTLLAEVALRRGELPESQRLALEGYERLGARKLVVDERRAAADRLARVYEALEVAEPGAGHAAEAATWRARLKELSP